MTREPTPADRPDPAAAGVAPVAHRKIVYLMAFRTGLITLLFGIVVAALLVSDRPLRVASRYSQAIFALIILSYVCSLLYAALFRQIRHKERFYTVQVAVDLLLVSALVHLTGGVHSVYSFLFPLLIVEATIVFYSRGALVATVAVTLSFVLVAVGGWLRFIPTVADQPLLPWKASTQELAKYLILNLGGQICIAILAAFLADQLRSADERVAEQRRTIGDIVRLNENVLQSLQTGLITVDTDGHVMTANRAAAALLRRSENALAAQELAELVPALADLDATGPPVRRRTTVTPAGDDARPVPVEVRVSPLLDRNDQRSGSLVLLEDLTEISAMEDRVKHAERMAALGRLAAGVAHEIRNPLASVSGALELLSEDTEADEDEKRLLSIATREVERLAGLVTSLLEYARPRPLERMELDVAELAREVATSTAQDPTFAEAPVTVDAPDDGCVLDVDADQLRQVLWNLYRNAAEATDGDEVKVCVTPADRDGEPGATLTVTDAGPGIPADDLEKVFEPFFTTKDSGTGLGLAVVHRIVEDHGGTVEVQTPVADGRGTRVALWLPRSAEDHRSVPTGGDDA